MTNAQGKSVFMVGAFPPPVHGMAAVNEAVSKLLRTAHVNPVVINTSASSLDRSWTVRLGRLPRVVYGLMRLLCQSGLRRESFYMGVSAGFGQIYEILFLLIARMNRMKVYIHHHSFQYLEHHSQITQVLTIIAGPESVHIALSPGMKAYLHSRYPFSRKVFPISNAVFSTDLDGREYTPRKRLHTIGFLSNICEEKGILEFLDLVSACEDSGLGLRVRIAGPFKDAQTEQFVRARMSELSDVQYAGPVYGNKKADFFSAIDALVFPSRNEAAPVTIYEAMRAAVPVIARGCGCIPEIVSPAAGLVINPGEAFVPAALNQLKRWRNSPGVYTGVSRRASELFNHILEDSACRWRNLLHDMLDDDKGVADKHEGGSEVLLSNA